VNPNAAKYVPRRLNAMQRTKRKKKRKNKRKNKKKEELMFVMAD
jgi:hypothetical protein